MGGLCRPVAGHAWEVKFYSIITLSLWSQHNLTCWFCHVEGTEYSPSRVILRRWGCCRDGGGTLPSRTQGIVAVSRQPTTMVPESRPYHGVVGGLDPAWLSFECNVVWWNHQLYSSMPKGSLRYDVLVLKNIHHIQLSRFSRLTRSCWLTLKRLILRQILSMVSLPQWDSCGDSCSSREWDPHHPHMESPDKL